MTRIASALTEEQIEELRHDADWTARNAGAPGSNIRAKATNTLTLLAEHALLLRVVEAVHPHCRDCVDHGELEAALDAWTER